MNSTSVAIICVALIATPAGYAVERFYHERTPPPSNAARSTRPPSTTGPMRSTPALPPGYVSRRA